MMVVSHNLVMTEVKSITPLSGIGSARTTTGERGQSLTVR